jgi:hypothetical protein
MRRNQAQYMGDDEASASRLARGLQRVETHMQQDNPMQGAQREKNRRYFQHEPDVRAQKDSRHQEEIGGFRLEGVEAFRRKLHLDARVISVGVWTGPGKSRLDTGG